MRVYRVHMNVHINQTERAKCHKSLVESGYCSQTGENKMNKKIIALSLGALMASLTVGFAAAQSQQQTYSGTVTASQIASTGGSSSVGTWMKKLNCHSEADCSRQLVQAGGKYVLMTAKGTYQLNDQSKFAQYAGLRVTVTGAFDSPKKTIEVADVQPYNPSSQSAGVQ